MKKTVKNENFLEKIPVRREDIAYSCDDNGIVTLEIENKGAFNRIAQKLFKKPKVSYVHLDEIGSYIWPLIDGEKNIIKIGKELQETLGDKVNPLYERLAKYFQILASYGFVSYK